MEKWRRIAISLVFGLLLGIVVTDLLQNIIYFSLFVGIPAGFAAAIGMYILLGKSSNK